MALPQISVTASANGKETDGSPVVFSFSRTGSTDASLSVGYQLFGTARAGSDYSGSTTGTISFAAGSANATLSLPALEDGALIDPGETIIARIDPAESYSITPGKQFAIATITAEGMVVSPKASTRPDRSGGEVRNGYAFAALKSDGSVVSWGNTGSGGTAPTGLSGVAQIFSTFGAFAALKSDGSVASWGNSGFGGTAPTGLSGVTQIFSTFDAFAALKSDGSVVTWGNSSNGGTAPAGLSGVTQIFSNESAFAALKSDGSVVSWGRSDRGGTAPTGLSGVSQIFSTGFAFAALKSDGSVVTWGNSSYGGTAPTGLSGVAQIFSTFGAFAALKSDGSVVTWGNSSYGGTAPAGLSGVTQIFSTYTAFAALKSDGSVVTWGNSSNGGTAPAGLSGVTQIFSNGAAFAALKSDGSVVSWGASDYGGTAPTGLSGVTQIFSTGSAFAALKSDGSVVSWGNSSNGGTAPAGLSGVTQIISTSEAFAALKSDGTVVSWGNSSSGGTAPTGLTGVVGFANPYTDDRLVIAATPTYTLTPSSATINEGAVLTSTVTTTNVASGTKLYYALSGTGITTADFSAGALTGEGTTDSAGKFSFTHTLANDLATEGAESIVIKLFSDAARTLQVGASATVSVADTSNGLQKIDLNKGETDLLLNTRITDASGLNSLNLSFSLANPPSGGSSTSLSAYIATYSDKLSGSPKDGIYSSIVKVGGNALPGTYAISTLQIEDSIGNRIYKYGADLDKYLVSIGIDKSSLSFEVIGTPPVNADLLEPRISSATLSSKIVDLSKGETDLLLNTRITDGSGFNSSYLSFSLVNPPSGVSAINPSANINIYNDKISGSTKDGNYSSTVKVGGSALPGTYGLSSLQIEDSIGNRVHKYGADLDKYLVSIGIDKASLTFEVVGTAPANIDSAEPKISSALLSSKIVDLSKGETDLLLNTRITDVSGFNYSNLSFSLINPPSGGTAISPSASILTYNDKMSGNTKDGTYSSIVKVGGNALPGTYAISNLSIEDSIGNRISKYGADLDKYLVSIGIDKASLSFEVIGTTPLNKDSAEPKLVSVKLESIPKIDSSSIPQMIAGSTITIELDFNDISGIGYQQYTDNVETPEDNVGFIIITNPNYSQLIAGVGMYSFTRADIIKGTDKIGTLRKTIKLTENVASGQWNIQSLWMNDKNGNSLNAYLNNSIGATPSANELVKFAAKFGVTPESTSFNVINNNPNSIIDNEPPKITAIRFGSKEIAIGATGGEIILELDFSDISGISIQQNIEGVDSPDDYAGSISLANSNYTSMNGIQNYYSFTRADIIKGTEKNGTFRKTITLTENAIPGKWYIQNLLMNDKSGNSLNAYLNSSTGGTPSASEVAKFAAKLGVPAESTSFNVINNNPVSAIDNEPPKITAIRFSSKEIAIGATGGEITFELDFNDMSGIIFQQNTDGIDSLDDVIAFYTLADFRNFRTFNNSGFFTRSDIIKGNDKNGTLRKTIKFSENAASGQWNITTFWMNDKSGNSLNANIGTSSGSTISANEIAKFAAKLGVPAESTSFNVINNNTSSIIDNEPPKITAIRIFSESTPAPIPTYTLTPSSATINEGAVLTSTVTTTNVATGTKLYYALSGTGITTADFSAGALTGEGTTDSAGKFSFTHTLANDQTTEGAETVEIKLFSDIERKVQVGSTASVGVIDSSLTPIPMAANLIINGDFEATRVPNPQTENYLIEHKPYGWELTASNGVDLLNDVHSKFGANKTTYGQYVELDGRSNTGIKQAISTQIGSRYKFSFDWALPSYSSGKYSFPDPSSKFDVAVNGRVIFSYDGSYGVRNAWTHQDIGFTATANTTEISFIEKGVSDAEGTLLDNISVSVESQASRVILIGNTGKGTDLPSGDTTAIKLDDGTLVVLAFKDPQLVAAPYGGGDVLGKGLIRFLDPQTGIATKPDIILGTGKTIVSGIEKTPGNGFIVFGQAKESLYGKQFGGATDAFVVKYRADGTFQWIQSYNTSLHESVASASVDPSGKILISGRASYDLSEPRNFGSQSWYGQALGGRYYAAFTSSISAQGTIDWVNVYGGLSGGIGVEADKNGYVSSIYTGINSTPTNYSYFDYNNSLKWSKDVNVNDYSAAMDAFYGQGIIALVTSSSQVSLVNESGATLKIIAVPNAGTIHDIEVKGDKLFILSRSGSTNDLEVSAYDKSGLQHGASLSIPGSAIFVDKYYFDYDLAILDDGKYVISGNKGDAGFPGAVIGDYREYILFDPNPKPIIRGNSLYTIVDGPSWTQAEANSVKLGGHLVAINDADENLFVSDFSSVGLTTKGENHSGYWGRYIGLSDSKIEGTFEWTSGEKVSYENWYPNEPNSYLKDGHAANADFAEIFPIDGLGPYGAFYPGKWNDAYGNGENSTTGIAETPFIRRGDSAYVIVQGPTWEEAEANAVKLGGHLVTINDAAENEFLSSSFTFQSPVQPKFIGLKELEEGNWVWIDGSTSTYRHWFYDKNISWNPQEPNNNKANEQYGVMYFHDYWTNPLGWWGDGLSNGADLGIAEIKLAPNNTPTGTPTVTGTLKVGSTLTIDATAIKDSDNFTAYTPTLKYNWETSTDGTTWSKLTSTDAADNNNTYILTAAEANKKIRGVVSYLDGYGTQESVATTSSAPIASGAPPVQSLTLTPPSKSAIRSGISTTTAIAYNVSTGETALTGVGASLYFDSTQLSVSIAGDPFKTGLLGNAITADTSNADGDPKTDKVLSLSYADFSGNFPGNGTTLPLVLANLNLVPTNTFSGSTLHLKGDPAVGFTATGADLALGYNASPVVNNNLAAFITNRNSAFSYTFRSDLFTDPDSTLSFSATTNTGNTLPSWLSFNPTTRTLSGTPTTAGTINLNLSATDELGSVSTPLTLKVREVQSLSSSSSAIRYQRNKELTVPINYSTTDGLSTTGLSFKVHFNSSLLSFNSTTGVTNKTQADLFQIGAIQQDTANTDNDATTDSFIPINIASFTGQFPTAGVPVKLADLIFKSLDKPIDPITGLKDTSINFTETEAASGYGFSASSASLKPLSFTLDLDGDGKITALGDGLMIIRKLFGAAFAGDALTNKAISPTATRTTAEIHDFIQQGIDGGLLDVDKDGKTTALGDGLMVIRHLFGAAFAGDALTNKAISPSSPYFGPPINHAAVAANIDALKII